jgi:plastocyanin
MHQLGMSQAAGFSPETVTVREGQTITWDWADSNVPHNIRQVVVQTVGGGPSKMYKSCPVYGGVDSDCQEMLFGSSFSAELCVPGHYRFASDACRGHPMRVIVLKNPPTRVPVQPDTGFSRQFLEVCRGAALLFCHPREAAGGEAGAAVGWPEVHELVGEQQQQLSAGDPVDVWDIGSRYFVCGEHTCTVLVRDAPRSHTITYGRENGEFVFDP